MSSAAPLDVQKETGGKNINNLVRCLNPEQFYIMFTKEKCTYEEKLIREILECICALRNSGGGKLTIRFTGTYSTSQVNWCIDYIRKAVDEVLSSTARTDLVEFKLSNKIILLIKYSKKIVSTNFNPNLLAKEGAKTVPRSKSVKEKRANLDRSKQQTQCAIFPEIVLLPVQEFSINRASVLRGEDQTTSRTIPSPTPESRKFKGKLVRDQRVEAIQTTPSPYDATVLFKTLENVSPGMTNSVMERILHDKNNLLAYVCDLANDRGGCLYYGISSDGRVLGEEITNKERKKVIQGVKDKIISMLRIKDNEKILKIKLLHVEDDNCPNLYVIQIRVKPCSGVYLEKANSYHLGKYDVEKLCSSDLSTGVSDTTIIKFETTKEAFELCFLPNDYATFLKSLDWVESCSIVDENEECDLPHLEVVCKLSKVPRTSDIVNHFGEEILPFITYKECTKRKWFETNIFDKSYEMKEEYDEKLSSFPWVKDYEVGVATKPETSWQIFITCAKNKVPRMDELKELFGVNIVHFVDFMKESIDGNLEQSAGSSSCIRLGGPSAGDELEHQFGSGTISIVATAKVSDRVKHYATTCYHVCSSKSLLENPSDEHQILIDDFKSDGCKGINYKYKSNQNSGLLGNFGYGLYDDKHDIALVELNQDLDCSDAVNFLRENGITSSLADKKEVSEMLYDSDAVEKIGEAPRRVLNVEKFGSVTGVRNGKLFAIAGKTRCPKYKRCYRIVGQKRHIFAKKGDSGSLVYAIHGGAKVPFGYLCIKEREKHVGTVYYCRNLSDSLDELKTYHNLKEVEACLSKESCGEQKRVQTVCRAPLK